MTSKKRQSPWKVLIAIALGIIIGDCTQQGKSIFGVDLFSSLHPLYEFFGSLFINALTLVVIPLVASSVITGIARVGDQKSVGRLGLKMVTFYISTTLLAILIGLFFVNIIGPGFSVTPEHVSISSDLANAKHQLVETHANHRFIELLLKIIPSNIFAAFAKTEMLGIIFFSLLFGYCASKVKSSFSQTVLDFAKGIFQIMIEFTHVVIKFLPIGVFFLVAKTMSETGLHSLYSMGLFTVTVFLGFICFTMIALPLLLKWIAKVSPIRHFKAMTPAIITAFSTSSSSATLPITIDCVEKRAGVSNRICSLVIPLGTSLNMSGSALYECVAAMFIAQAYGIELSFVTQFSIVVLALISSIGVAGVPSASLVALIVILKTMGLPIDGIGLFIAVDRLLDMCRTTVNVFSDSCCAVLVARSEGEKSVLTKKVFD